MPYILSQFLELLSSFDLFLAFILLCFFFFIFDEPDGVYVILQTAASLWGKRNGVNLLFRELKKKRKKKFAMAR